MPRYKLRTLLIVLAIGPMALAFAWHIAAGRQPDPVIVAMVSLIVMLLAVIVGGSGKFFGPLLGTIVIVLLPEWLRFMQNWYLAGFGFAIVALMIWLPGGILSIPERLRMRRVARPAVAAPDTLKEATR